MKASDLIIMLQDAIEKDGDLEVWAMCWNEEFPIDAPCEMNGRIYL